MAILVLGVRTAAAGGAPTTSSTTSTTTTSSTTSKPRETSSTTTTLPAALRCQNGVERALGKLMAKLTKCSVAAAKRAFKGKPSREDGCREKAKRRYDRRTARLRKCPDCLAPRRLPLADEIVSLIAAAREGSFCPGNVTSDRAALRCRTKLQRIAGRYLGGLFACRTQAARKAFRGETPSEAGCRLAARPRAAAYGRCTACGAYNDLLDELLTASAGFDREVFCPCVFGAPGACPSDGNACTLDTCDPALGCSYPAAANGTGCDPDGNRCTKDLCRDGTCRHDELEADGVQCPDTDLCNGAESCRAGVCSAGVTVTCPEDGNLCTDNSCDPTSGMCATTFNTAPCEDGNACTEDDACDGNGHCIGSFVDCDDGDPCTRDTCSSVAGCVNNPIPGCP